MKTVEIVLGWEKLWMRLGRFKILKNFHRGVNSYFPFFIILLLNSSCDNEKERTLIQNSIDKEWHAQIKVEASSNSDSKAAKLADYGRFRGGFGLAGIFMANSENDNSYKEIFVWHRMNLNSKGAYEGSWFFDFGHPINPYHQSVLIKEQGEWRITGANRLELKTIKIEIPETFKSGPSTFEKNVLDNFEELSSERHFKVENIDSEELIVWTGATINQGVMIRYVSDQEQRDDVF